METNKTSQENIEISESEAKQLIFYGRTNDSLIIIDKNDNSRIDFAMECMFESMNNFQRNRVEEIFWNRIIALTKINQK